MEIQEERIPQHWGFLDFAIKKGMIQMLNDGIVMPDQASTYFDDLINVYEYGREFSLEGVWQDEQIGWAIDTFGASATMAAAPSQRWATNVEFINRINYRNEDRDE